MHFYGSSGRGFKVSIFTDNVVTILTSLALLIAFFSLFIGAVYWYVCHKEARESHLIVSGELDGARHRS